MQVLHWNQRVLLMRYIKPEFPEGVYKYQLTDSDTFLKHLYPQGTRIIGDWLGTVDPPISQTIAFAVVDTQRWAVLSRCTHLDLWSRQTVQLMCAPRAWLLLFAPPWDCPPPQKPLLHGNPLALVATTCGTAWLSGDVT